MNYFITETHPRGNSRVISRDGWPHEWEGISAAVDTLKQLQFERPRNTSCLIPVTEDGKEMVRLIVSRNEADSTNR